MLSKKVALIILDGWGEGEKYAFNAVTNAQKPYLDSLFARYPHTLIEASGEAVGLPEGQMGNSEVGHLNIGAGRVVYQELTRISKEIREGNLYKNPELCAAMSYAQDNGKAVHFLGLLSDGGVHSHNTHLYALLKMAQQNYLQRVYVHAFMDGRDTPPQSGKEYMQELVTQMQSIGTGKVATVSGRYYAMDRDKRYERVEKAYRAMVENGATIADPVQYIADSYTQGVYDEFVVPMAVQGTERVQSGDVVIFFNFRPDRAREITRAFVDANFDGFALEGLKDLYYVCMTEYDPTITARVAYQPQNITNTLGEVLAKSGKKQLRIAETEKYAHVTFFFNGGVEAPNANEERVLIASPRVATYDLQPEMSAYTVKDRLLELLAKEKFDAIILNFANPDMVGHTGVYEAGCQAMQAVDSCLSELVPQMLQQDYAVLITADHGNLEMMRDLETCQPYTAHTSNPVPLILVTNGTAKQELRTDGALCDIAATMLELMDMEQPTEMTGTSLIQKTGACI